MRKVFVLLCICGLTVSFSACEKESSVEEIPQLVIAQNAEKASQGVKRNIENIISIKQQSEVFQSLLRSSSYQNFLQSFPRGLNTSTLRLATFNELANESAIVGKVIGSNLELVAYAVTINGSTEYRILLKDQRTTVDKQGRHSGEFSLLNEKGRLIKKFVLQENRVTAEETSQTNLLPEAERTCFGACVERTTEELEDDILSYIACSINPCWIAIAAYCAYGCG